MRLAVLVSRHSAFYSPLIATITSGFLEREGLDATYGVLEPGQTSREMIASGRAHVIQSAVSTSWGPMEKGERDLPVHFAQINRRDGFFVVGRHPDPDFRWTNLEGREFLADHAAQPLAMMMYAARSNGVDWSRVRLVDAGGPDSMESRFRSGAGDFVQLQGPAAQQLEADGVGTVVACAGASTPPVAFSSLTASRDFLATGAARAFLRAYAQARAWVRKSPAGEVAASEAALFPSVTHGVLAAAIARYQRLGCWD
ncbi:MAG: ABC transporter substrate-binding protein, partial [Bryobacteraceae bacterium]